MLQCQIGRMQRLNLEHHPTFSYTISGSASLFIVESKNHVEVKKAEPVESSSVEKDAESASVETVKKPEEKPSFFAAIKVFKDPRFLSLSMSELTACIGFLIPLYYMQSKSQKSGDK